MNNRESRALPARKQGIDWATVRVLLYSFLVMDFRNQAFGQVTRSGAKDVFSPLYWVTGQNLLISFFVAGVLYARVESSAFALICISVSMLVCVTSIIVEFNEIILSPDDLHVLGHQPVSYETYALARLINLLLYIAYIILTLNVVPAILGVGLRETSVWFILLFPLATVVGSFLAAGCIILFYVLFVAAGPSSRVQETLAWTQAVLMLITGYGGQAVLRDTRDQLEMAIYQLPPWVYLTPPGWLAQFVVSGNGEPAEIRWWILGLAVLATAVVWFLVYRFLAVAYARLPSANRGGAELLPPLAVAGQLLRPTGWWRSPSPDEQTAYWFCKTMLKRDHNFRMRIWPTFGVTIAFLGIGIFTGELVDPFSVRGKSVVITLTAIYSIVLPLPAILYSMRFSKEYQCGWILGVAPIADSAAFARGLEKAILLWVMMPFLILLTAVLSWVWRDPVPVVFHVVAAALLILFSAFVSSGMIFRQIPFSQPLGRGEMIGPIAPMMAVVGAWAMMLAGVHYLASVSLLWFCGYLVLLVLATWIAYRYSRATIRRRCNLEWFHESN